ncbi:MAG TPA: hypothetical protein VN822_10485 [Candidatus Acidoferrales bacterium]|nr:hypothetical protein [Candidatus Acidoferrales bacterium]HYW46411.1 hypothetical protein [Bryobacteraceae bacterium]
MAKANEAIGGRLSQVLQRLAEDLAPQDRARFRDDVHLVFRPTSDFSRVWVDAVDYNPTVSDEGTLLRAFRIKLVPPDSAPKWEWILNESKHGAGVAYTPFFLDYDHTEPGDGGGDASPQDRSDGLHDPTVSEIQRAAQVLEECWRLFCSGENDAIYCWAGQK